MQPDLETWRGPDSYSYSYSYSYSSYSYSCSYYFIIVPHIGFAATQNFHLHVHEKASAYLTSATISLDIIWGGGAEKKQGDFWGAMTAILIIVNQIHHNGMHK